MLITIPSVDPKVTWSNVTSLGPKAQPSTSVAFSLENFFFSEWRDIFMCFFFNERLINFLGSKKFFLLNGGGLSLSIMIYIYLSIMSLYIVHEYYTNTYYFDSWNPIYRKLLQILLW